MPNKIDIPMIFSNLTKEDVVDIEGFPSIPIGNLDVNFTEIQEKVNAFIDEYIVSENFLNSIKKYFLRSNISQSLFNNVTDKTTFIIDQELTVVEDCNIPSNINFLFIGRGKINITSGRTLTINGIVMSVVPNIFYLQNGRLYLLNHVIFPITDIFNFDSSSIINFSALVSEVYPEWFSGDINKAIDISPAIVRLSAKNYYISTPIIIKSGKSLIGPGYDLCNIITNNSYINAIESEGSYWKLEGFKITGNINNENGIYITGSSREFIINNLYITNFRNETSSGLHLKGDVDDESYSGSIQNLFSVGNYIGVNLISDPNKNNNKYKFYNCLVSNSLSHGMRINSTDDVSIISCNIKNNAGYGINITNSSGFLLVGGSLENNTSGNFNYDNNTTGSIIMTNIINGHIYKNNNVINDYSQLDEKISFILSSNNNSNIKLNWLGKIGNIGSVSYNTARIIKSSGYMALAAQRITDTLENFYITIDGHLCWSNGSGSYDCRLRRTAANVLSLDNPAKLQTSRIQLVPLSSAPSNPQEGDMVYADGINWNPGSGSGVYVFTSTGWVKL